MKDLRISSQAGTTLIEVMVSAGILLTLMTGLVYKVKSVKAQVKETSRIMALEALEGSLIDFMRDAAIVAHSIDKGGPGALRSCFKGQSACTHNVKYEVPLIREGQNQAFTGLNFAYDRNAMPCPKQGPCVGPRLAVRTIVSPQCMKGSSCPRPDYTLVIAEIYSMKSGRILRKFAQEVEMFGDGKFPGLRLACPEASVLHGIGLKGEALCTPQGEIVLNDKAGKPLASELKVTPVDCRSLNADPNQQASIARLGADALLGCAPRFW